LRNVGIAFHME